MGEGEKAVKPPLIGEEVIPESLRLHSTIPTQTAAKMARFQKFQPKNAVSRTGAISFDIFNGDQKYMDVSSAVLHIECQIRDGKSEPIPLHGAVPEGGGDAPFHPLGKVLPTNGMGYTLFTNVKVALNNVPIDSGSVLYSYRGDFETRLFNTKDVKEGSAALMGFDEEIVAFESVTDVAANFPWEEVADDTTEPDSLAHAALNRRYKRSCQSKSIFLVTPIFSEIFDQDKWLPPKTKLFISLEQNKPAFSLLSKSAGAGDDSYKIEILNCDLYMKILEMDSMVDKEIENVTFQGNSMLYPLRRVKMEQHRISANMRDLSVTNILIGESELPRKIFVTFVRHDACNGDVRKDPFNYQHFGMDTIGLRVGGNERPYPSFKCNFRNGNILKPYWALLDATGFYGTDKELGITPETYPHRNVFFGFDLTTTGTPAGLCFESSESQNMEIVAHIREAKDFPIEMIVYAEYDAELEIQPGGKVVMHSNA